MIFCRQPHGLLAVEPDEVFRVLFGLEHCTLAVADWQCLAQDFLTILGLALSGTAAGAGHCSEAPLD